MIFKQGAFQIDPNATPEELQRRREALQAARPRYGSARYVGEGLGHMFSGLSEGLQTRRLNKAETAGRKKGDGLFAQIMGQAGSTPISSKGADAAGEHYPGDGHDHSNVSGAQSIANDALSAVGQTPWLRYSNQGAVRNKPINDKLKGALSFLPELGVEMEVFSGGQDDHGPNRVGSTRHDHGNAADVFFYKDGKKLDWSNPEHRPVFQQIVARAKANGVAGIGAGQNYMQPGSMHIGFGKAAVWGKGGKGANAPDWLRAAYNGTAPAGGATTMTTSGGGPAMATSGGGRDLTQLQAAMASPWLSQDQKAVIGGMIQQEQAQQQYYRQQNDPMRQMQLEKARLELANMQAGGGRKTQYVKGRGLMDMESGEIISPEPEGVGGDTEFGLTPQYVTNPDGTLGMVQLGKDGSVNVVELPDNLALQKGVEKLDLGDSFQWYNTITGEPIGEKIAKNLANAEQQKAIGRAEGEAIGDAKASVGAETAKGQDAVALIDQILADPALPKITGRIQGRLPPLSQAGTDLNAKITQLQGKTFLEAIQFLKGSGSLSDAEGKKAGAAIARLERSQSDGAYREALLEFRNIVQGGIDRARAKAGASPLDHPPAPAAGAQSNEMSREQFVSDPRVQAAAADAGITPEDMWAIREEMKAGGG